MRAVLILAVLALAGCPDGSMNARDIVYEPPIFTDAGCDARYQRHALEPPNHVAFDAAVTWGSNPPSSGPHFGFWARWGIHRDPVPRIVWVHNLEHGGVVVTHRCDGDCTNLRRDLEAFVTDLPPDPVCLREDAGIRRRVILTQDSMITTPVAAAAWGYTYNADCLDRPSLQAFILATSGRTDENFCADGFWP